MKLKTLGLVALVAISAQAKTVKEDFKVDISVKGKIQVVSIETEEACAQMVDPAWSHEEDTTTTRTVRSNSSFRKTEDQIKKLQADGFRFYGYADGDKCEYKNFTFTSTFPEFKNPNPMNAFTDDVFFHMITNKKLSEYAEKANAFKKVKRVYVKGDKEFIDAAKSEAFAEVQSVLKSL